MKNYILSTTGLVISFIIYLITLAPTVYWGDSGELITAIYTLGIPHPAGIPLYVLMGKLLNGSSVDAQSLAGVKQAAAQVIKQNGGIPKGACVPRIAPGLQFWADGDAKTVCAQANALCPVTYEKGLFGKGEGKCVKNCECLQPDVEQKRAQVCMAMGDCGPKVNYLGQQSSSAGYKVTKTKLASK